MNFRSLIYLCVSIAVISVQVAVIHYLGPKNFTEIPAATLVTAGTRCDEASIIAGETKCADATSYRAEALPTIFRDRDADTHLIMRMRFQFEREIVPHGVASIYLPKISDAIQLRLNGEILVDMGDLEKPPIRHWNKPVFVSFPRSLLLDSNLLEVAVSAYQPDGAMLHPFYVGPETALRTPYMVRFWATAGVARLGLAFMSLTAVLFGFLFLAQKFKPTYGWLLLASISSFVFISHFAVSIMPFPYVAWTITWNFALNLLVLSMYIFTARYLGQKPSAFERFYCGFPFLMLCVLAFIPDAYILDIGGFLHVGTIILGLATAKLFLKHKDKLQFSNFLILYLIFTFSLALCVRDWIYVYNDPTSVNMLVSQFSIVIMMGAYSWISASDLIHSVAKFNQLNSGLQLAIDEKSKELQQSFEKLADVERQQVVERERQRIMLDLHDGVGGQLVNTLAYMQNQNVVDPTLQSSLETALREIGLMVDSLENHNSLSTALGMLRERLEPLLDATGLAFNWEVRVEPNMDTMGPTQILNILRIAQEAITNVVKHASATLITVETTNDSLRIIDNGIGLPETIDNRRDGSNSGLGLRGMRQRAEAIGAKLTIEKRDKGSMVTLQFTGLEPSR